MRSGGRPPVRWLGFHEGKVPGQCLTHFIGTGPAGLPTKGDFMDYAVPGQRRGADYDIRAALLEIADQAGAHRQYVARPLIGLGDRSAGTFRILCMDLGVACMFGGRELRKREILRSLSLGVEPGFGLLRVEMAHRESSVSGQAMPPLRWMRPAPTQANQHREPGHGNRDKSYKCRNYQCCTHIRLLVRDRSWFY